MKKGMTKKEFEEWRKDWFLRIPKCKEFLCCHELDSCGIKRFCGNYSIYPTYARDPLPHECDDVGCIDCARKYICKREQCGFSWNSEHEPYDYVGFAWDGDF